MRNRCKHLLSETMTQKQCPFLIAGRATTPLTTGESNEELFFAVRTTDSRKSLFDITALYELINGRTDDRSPEAVLFLILLRIHALERIKMIPDYLEKRRSRMVAGTVKHRLYDVLVLHNVVAEIAVMHTVRMNSIK